MTVVRPSKVKIVVNRNVWSQGPPNTSVMFLICCWLFVGISAVLLNLSTAAHPRDIRCY